MAPKKKDSQAVKEVENLISQGYQSCHDKLFEIINSAPSDEEELLKMAQTNNQKFTKLVMPFLTVLTAIAKQWSEEIAGVVDQIAREHNIAWIVAMNHFLPPQALQALLLNATRKGLSEAAISLALVGVSTEMCSAHDVGNLAQFAQNRIVEPNDEYDTLRNNLLKEAREKASSEIVVDFQQAPPEIKTIVHTAAVAVTVLDADSFREALDLIEGDHQSKCFRILYYLLLSMTNEIENKNEIKPFFQALAQFNPAEFTRYFTGVVNAVANGDVPDAGAAAMLRNYIDWGLTDYVIADPDEKAKFIDWFWKGYHEFFEKEDRLAH
jgi:hypothetical protein